MSLGHDPESVGRRLLSEVGQRWRHTQGVASVVQDVIGQVGEGPDAVRPAAWLHDIGYAPDLQDTGLHSLDGARYLAQHGWDPRVVNLVAHHSCARYEAEERGLAAELAAFPREDAALEDALTYADMTVGPTGERVAPDQRLEEILQRYPEDSPVHRAVTRARPEILAACARTAQRLAASGIADDGLDWSPAPGT